MSNKIGRAGYTGHECAATYTLPSPFNAGAGRIMAIMTK
jgi:hypothetical protein